MSVSWKDRSCSALRLAGVAAAALALTSLPPADRTEAQEAAQVSDQELKSYYQDNFRKLSKIVFSRMLKQMQAYPELEGSEDIFVVSSLIPALERRIPGFCRFETPEDREKFFSQPQQMLMTRDQFSLFAETSCDARLFFLKDRDFIYAALRAETETPQRDRYGRNIIVEVISGADSHEDFIELANQSATDLGRSGALLLD